MGILSFFRKKSPPPAAVPSDGSASPPAPVGTGVPSRPRAASSAPVALPWRPVVTEKVSSLAAHNQFVFRVGARTTKPEIRRTIERAYAVHVEGVRLLNTHGKMRRRGRVHGMVPGYRKAVVTIRQGERIDLAVGGVVDQSSKRP